MAVAFDAAASADGNGTTATLNITVAANSIVFVGVHFNGSPTASNPLFDGNAMTLVAGPVNDVYLYRYHGHAAGLRTASLTRSDSGDWAIGAVSFTGVDLTSPIGTAQTAVPDATPTTTPNITSGSADWMILDACMMASAEPTTTAANGAQTERVSNDAYNDSVLSFGMSTKPGSAAETTMQWTTTGEVFGSGIIGVPIRPAATGSSYSLTAEQGSYSLNGQVAGLLTGGFLSAEFGSYSLIGSEALRDIEMDAELGSYALNGQIAVVIRAALTSAEQGSYVLNGQAANLVTAAGPPPLEDAGLLARYFLNEAGSGTAPTQALDSSGFGTPFNLTLDYGGGSMAYVENFSNRGLDSFSTSGTQGARLAVNDTSDKIRDALHNSMTATMEVVYDADAFGTNGSRIFTLFGAADVFGISGHPLAPVDHLRLFVNGTQVLQTLTGFSGSRIVLHLVLDTTQATDTNRVKLYVNGVLVTSFTATAYPALNAVLNLPAGTQLAVAGLGTGTRNIDGQVYYAALYDTALSAAEVANNYSVLTTDDDGDQVAIPSIGELRNARRMFGFRLSR